MALSSAIVDSISGGNGVTREGGLPSRHKDWCFTAPLSSTIYRKQGAGVGLSPQPLLQGGPAAREESSLHKEGRRPPPQRHLRGALTLWDSFPQSPCTSRGRFPQPRLARVPPLQMMWAHRVGGPSEPFQHPGTLPIMPITFLTIKIELPIYKYLPLDHFGTLVTYRVSSSTPNNIQ